MENNSKYLQYVCSRNSPLLEDEYFFLIFFLFICYSMKKSYLARLRGKSSQKEQPTSLGNLFLVFFFGLLHPLSQKFSILPYFS